MKSSHTKLPVIKPLVLAVAMGSQQLYAECLSEYTVTKTTSNSGDISTLYGAFRSISNNCSDTDITVTIADELAGETIAISEVNLYAYSGNNITVTGPSENRTTIRRDSTLSLFIAQESGQLHLKNLILDGKKSSVSSSVPGVDAQSGSNGLSIENVLFQNFRGNVGAAVQAINTDLTIIDSVFTDNEAGSNGGAIYVGDGNLTVESSTFTNNSTTDPSLTTGGGGAIAFVSETNDHSLSITNSQFDGNTAFHNGGAIYHKDKGQVVITGTTFDNNHAANWAGGSPGAKGGAAVLSSVAESSITGSNFTNNESGHLGGALYFDNNESSQFTELEISNTVFEGNSANIINVESTPSNGDGAAIYMTDSSETFHEDGTYNTTLNLDRVAFKSNTAQGNGGALYLNRGNLPFAVNISDSTFESDQSTTTVISVQDAHTVNVKRSLFTNNLSTVINAAGDSTHKPITTVENSTFTGNTSANGLIHYTGSIGAGSYIRHSTFSGNTSSSAAIIYGGGVSGMEEDLLISHTILSNNTSAYGQVCNLGEANMEFSLEYSLIDNADINASCRSNTDNGGNQFGTTDVLIDPLLEALADNGGYTQTMLIASNSPAVDAGNANIEDAPDTDQRGNSRVLRGQIDIGAVEIGNTLPVFEGPTDVTLDVSEALSIDIDLAIDADGDSLTYSVSGLPEGITFDENLNTISGSISETVYNAATSYDITITANDGFGETQIVLTVNLTDTTGLFDEDEDPSDPSDPSDPDNENDTTEEDEEESTTIGSLHYAWLSLIGLLLFRRRR